MKLNKLTAVLLAFCMLLTCVPAMAAQVSIPGGWSTAIIPQGEVYGDVDSVTLVRGASVKDGGDSIQFGTSKEWYVGLTKVSDADYANYVANNNLIGAKNPFEGVYAKGYFSTGTKTIYYKDVPVSGVGRNGGGSMVFLALRIADIEANQYDSNYTKKLTTTDEDYVDYATINSVKNSIVPATAKFTALYGMPKEPVIVETPLPAGTIYISVSDLDNSVSKWTPAESETYPIITKSEKTTEGPSRVFVAPASGTYVAYGFRKDKSDDSPDRICRIMINGSQFDFDKSHGAPLSHAWFWDTCNEGQTVTLTEGDIMAVSMSKAGSGNYNRITAIALVPATETEFISAFDLTARTNSANAITADNFKTLSSLNEKIDLTANTVSATVNGTAVNASKWHDSAATTDIFGDVIDGPSVYDAIVASGSTIKADGTDAKSIFVNGKQIYNADKYALNANDAIVIKSGNDLNIDNFSAVKASLVRNTEGSLNGLKYCLTTSKLTSRGFSFLVKDKTNNNNLVGARLAGYWYNTEDMVILNTDLATDAKGNVEAPWQFGDAESVRVPAGTRSYMMNKVFDTSAEDTNADRISLCISTATFGNSNRAIFMKDAANNIAAFKEANGFQFIKERGNDHAFENQAFNKDNLFITNAQADGSIEVVRKAEKFAITTNGVAHLALVRVKANGTTSVEEAAATVLTPFVGALEAGETIYVWGYNQINGEGMNINTQSGVNMIPMCAPIK